MGNIKVLLVDDHAMLRDGIRALLGIGGDIEVVGEASDGAEAVRKARELAPDVVLMDMAMPGMDGFEATRRIKKKVPGAKVLVLTQHENREYVLAAVKAGADGFIPKRAASGELVSAISAVHSGSNFLYPSAAVALIQDYRQLAKEEPYDHLTTREREVLKLVAEGHTSREIAGMLAIGLRTVLAHRNKTMVKLDLHNHAQLLKYAMRRGLVRADA